ncbi:thioesterase domain-containing protein [Variovorax boronicumulans]|uniref:thioesterase domain-containing protein n=1 Tax=Variovorax boronicumulans TaxID=436515 RepID=UPI001C585F13
MVLQAVVPIATFTAALTLKSDTAPVKVYVKTPRGTLYWGGAGLNGDYIKPTLAAFQVAGIKNLSVGLTNTGGANFPYGKDIGGTFIDAFRAGLVIRYEDSGDWVLTTGMDAKEGQFNLIGYSYGSLLAAQTANFYANKGHIVDHLVLIGSPIDREFLAKLRANQHIQSVVVVDLTDKGDVLHAGMTQLEVALAIPTLGRQFGSGKAEGHFYYAQVVKDSPARWKSLAQNVFDAGVR